MFHVTLSSFGNIWPGNNQLSTTSQYLIRKDQDCFLVSDLGFVTSFYDKHFKHFNAKDTISPKVVGFDDQPHHEQ